MGRVRLINTCQRVNFISHWRVTGSISVSHWSSPVPLTLIFPRNTVLAFLEQPLNLPAGSYNVLQRALITPLSSDYQQANYDFFLFFHACNENLSVEVNQRLVNIVLIIFRFLQILPFFNFELLFSLFLFPACNWNIPMKVH